MKHAQADIGRETYAAMPSATADVESGFSSVVLTGCEGIARGALEANVRFATCYPGEPATGVATALEAAACAHPELGLHFEWSLNEGCAFEKAFAASWTGVRSLVVMKHVGLNVAMDAFQTMAEKECGAGFVIVIGADPGPESSQNSQDERSIISDVGLLGIEPRDAGECLEFTRLAFILSEKHHLPVVVRVSPIIAEGFGPVRPGPLRREAVSRHFRVSKPMEFVTSVPTYAGDVRRRRALLSAIGLEVEELFCERQGAPDAAERERWGVIYSGLLAGPVEEVIEELGLPGLPRIRVSAFSPLPDGPLVEFLAGLSAVLVLEEQMPFLERGIGVLAQRKGIRVRILGKIEGEYTPFKAGLVNKAVVRRALERFLNERPGHQLSTLNSQPSTPNSQPSTLNSQPSTRNSQPSTPSVLLVPRALVFCPGCPHAGTHFALNFAHDEELKAWRKREPMIRSSDIGCYGSLPSFLGMAELKFHMGGGFGVAGGLANCELFTTLGGEEVRDPAVVAFAGDSTFFHSAVIRLLDAAANRVPCLYLVFDNKTVALTGLQPVADLPIRRLAEAMGVAAWVLNPFEVLEASRIVSEALEFVRREGKPAFVVAEGECALLPQAPQVTARKYAIVEEKCDGCGMCVEGFRCPALARDPRPSPAQCGVQSAECGTRGGELPKPVILPDICVGCGVCEVICQYSLTVDGKTRPESAIRAVPPPSKAVESSTAAPPQLRVQERTSHPQPSTLNSQLPFNVVVAGVGGMGLPEVTEVIVRAAELAGHEAVRGFVKGGISERFGAVYGIIRIGEGARTPSLAPGEADVVLALEPMEGLRACFGDSRAPSFASSSRTRIAVSTLAFPPLAVTLGERAYPSWGEIEKALEEKCARVEAVSAHPNFQERPVPHNSYLLGAACHLLEEVIPTAKVREAVGELVPEGLEGFEAGVTHFRSGR